MKCGTHLKLVESATVCRTTTLQRWSVENVHNTLYTLNNYVEGVNITYDENLNLFINSPYDAEYLVIPMSQGFLKAGSTEPRV